MQACSLVVPKKWAKYFFVFEFIKTYNCKSCVCVPIVMPIDKAR